MSSIQEKKSVRYSFKINSNRIKKFILNIKNKEKEKSETSFNSLIGLKDVLNYKIENLNIKMKDDNLSYFLEKYIDYNKSNKYLLLDKINNSHDNNLDSDFEKYKNTNAGIIDSTPVIMKGGKKNYTIDDEKLITYYSDAISIYKENINSGDVSDDIFLKNCFDKEVDKEVDNDICPIELFTFLKKEYDKYTISDRIKDENIYKITLYNYDDEKYTIKHLTNTTRNGPQKTELDFTHNGYNKNVVIAYEKNYIDNIHNLKNFFDKQKKYINNLNITELIIINDYTKKSCFDLYASYANAITREKNKEIYARLLNGNPIIEFYEDKKRNEAYYFGDSYYKQIFDVIGDFMFTKIIVNDLNDDDFIKYLNWLDKKKPQYNPFLYTFENINEYWNFIKYSKLERKEPNCVSIFKKKLTPAEWQCVLIIFANDINNIINNAPPTETDIYCYRGTTFDYVKLFENEQYEKIYNSSEKQIIINKGTYVSYRQGSFSVNSDISKEYTHNETTGETGNMYRVTIKKGTNVLYIPSLSFASKELEILHGGYAQFSVRGDFINPSFNNKKNKWGILSDLDKSFASVDIVMNGYNIPSPTEADLTNEELITLIQTKDIDIKRNLIDFEIDKFNIKISDKKYTYFINGIIHKIFERRRVGLSDM